MIKIKNLTPHPIWLAGKTYSPEGIVPRIAEIRKESIQLDGIVLNRLFVGEIENLPEPSDCFLVVSREVAQKAHRADVVSVCDYIRDEQGRIIGAESIAWFPPEMTK